MHFSTLFYNTLHLHLYYIGWGFFLFAPLPRHCIESQLDPQSYVHMKREGCYLSFIYNGIKRQRSDATFGRVLSRVENLARALYDVTFSFPMYILYATTTELRLILVG